MRIVPDDCLQRPEETTDGYASTCRYDLDVVPVDNGMFPADFISACTSAGVSGHNTCSSDIRTGRAGLDAVGRSADANSTERSTASSSTRNQVRRGRKG